MPRAQWREAFRRVRLRLKFEEQRLHLIDQASTGILRCLGCNLQLMADAIAQANVKCPEPESEEASVRRVMASLIGVAVEKAKIFGTRLPFEHALSEEDKKILDIGESGEPQTDF